MNLPEWLRKGWKEAAILAILAALVLEGGCNLIAGRTIWHRLSALEHSVQELEQERRVEELQTQHELEALRQKAEQNTVQVEKIEERVESKKKH